MLATLRHFARFIQEQRPFSVGFPFEGVKDLGIEGKKGLQVIFFPLGPPVTRSFQ